MGGPYRPHAPDPCSGRNRPCAAPTGVPVDGWDGSLMDAPAGWPPPLVRAEQGVHAPHPMSAPAAPAAESILARLPLLAGVPAQARARLAAAARPVRYRENEVVFRRGEPGADGMLLVLDGLVRLHVATAAGRELTLGLVGAGGTVGEIALIDGGPRSADVTALTPVSRPAASPCRCGRRHRIRPRRRRRPAADPRRPPPAHHRPGGGGRAADPAAAGRRRAGQAGRRRSRRAGAPLQGQLAALVAGTRPKVNAALAELRERGLVEPARAGLRLPDPAALRALAEAE